MEGVQMYGGCRAVKALWLGVEQRCLTHCSFLVLRVTMTTKT